MNKRQRERYARDADKWLLDWQNTPCRFNPADFVAPRTLHWSFPAGMTKPNTEWKCAPLQIVDLRFHKRRPKYPRAGGPKFTRRHARIPDTRGLRAWRQVQEICR